MSFEVLDCLDSLVRLTKRSPTLDGSVPVRVARACVPLLEGNAYGLQLTLDRPLRLSRRLGRWRAGWSEADGRDLERRHRGAVPRLAVEGFVPSPLWTRALEPGVAQPVAGGIRLFTGLLVKPDRGVWLRVTSAANRRNTLFEVVEQVIPDEDAWVPLVLELRPRRGAPSRIGLEGEIATIAPLRPDVRIRETSPSARRPSSRARISASTTGRTSRARRKTSRGNTGARWRGRPRPRPMKPRPFAWRESERPSSR